MFGLKNKYREKAENLIFLANTIAISSDSHYPILKDIVKDDRLLVFLVTVAGVCVGITLIDEDVSENEIMKFSYAIATELKKWNFLEYNPFGFDGAYTAYADLAIFLKDKHSEEYFVGMGFWLISNLKTSKPTNEEIIVGTAISKMLGTSLFGWWKLV